MPKGCPFHTCLERKCNNPATSTLFKSTVESRIDSFFLIRVKADIYSCIGIQLHMRRAIQLAGLPKMVLLNVIEKLRDLLHLSIMGRMIICRNAHSE